MHVGITSSVGYEALGGLYVGVQVIHADLLHSSNSLHGHVHAMKGDEIKKVQAAEQPLQPWPAYPSREPGFNQGPDCCHKPLEVKHQEIA